MILDSVPLKSDSSDSVTSDITVSWDSITCDTVSLDSVTCDTVISDSVTSDNSE